MNRKMKKELSIGKLLLFSAGLNCVLLGWLIFARPFSLFTIESPLSMNMVGFEMEQQQIEFVYPENWIVTLTPQGNHDDDEIIALLGNPDDSVFSFLNIQIAKNQGLANLTDLAEWGETRAKSRFISYKPSSVTRLSNEYFSGLVREYTSSTGSPFEIEPIRCKDWYFVNKNSGYSFSFCADKSKWIMMSEASSVIIKSIKPMGQE